MNHRLPFHHVSSMPVRTVSLVSTVLFFSLAAHTLESATFTVSSTSNSGAGTLRQAILDANAAGGADTIVFAIPGSAPFTIQPTSALPAITQPVIIDASTQPGFSGAPVIELRGTSAGLGANGLVITGGGTTLRGFVINRFSDSGIWIQGGDGNIVEGNYLGLNVAGTQALPNGRFGVVIYQSSDNRVGGTVAGARNIVSGNSLSGIIIQGPSQNNSVEGNYIGTDVTGGVSLGNGQNGILIFTSDANTIGGASLGARNLISGNGLAAVGVDGGAVGNQVQGNYLGTDASGTFSLGVQPYGVNINAAHDNLIGGTNTAERNLVSGNDLSGILIQGDSTGNLVQGNFIGSDATGTAALGNSENGVLLANATTNTIGGTAPGAGNTISGNGLAGVGLDPGASWNVIQGNLLGTDSSGSFTLGTQPGGVNADSADNNLIGGTNAAARNIISGNTLSGITLQGGASGNVVQGNFVGVAASGIAIVQNEQNGILITSADGNLIGGTAAGAGNVITGNGFSGIEMGESGSSNNVVQGNLIGTDLHGTNILLGQLAALNIHGAADNLIGGTTPGAGNIIAGHVVHGLRLWDLASGNRVQGNFIGTDPTGTIDLGNGGQGVIVQDGLANDIGGGAAGAGNLIAFNLLSGVCVETGSNILIRANSIFSNADLGIDLGGDGVSTNDVGDSDVGANQFQNYPVLTSAQINSEGSLTIEGYLRSRPNATYSLEFYASDTCDGSGYGEGQRSIGMTNLVTGPTGSNSFIVAFADVASTNSVITVTATDGQNNTSEFSECIVVLAATPAPEIKVTLTGSQLELSWPTLLPGWRLEFQTNAPGEGLTANWAMLLDPLGTNGVSLPIEKAVGSVFYRLSGP